MKRRKALSLLLSLAIVLSLVLPVTTAFAADGDTNEDDTKTSGLQLNKTAVYDAEKDAYTITLEAYATGESTITTQDIPTDFILVLDQSGSMDDPIGTVTFNQYTGSNARNSNLYNKRHNQDVDSNKNLWHKLLDGTYVSVSVTTQEKPDYAVITNGRNNQGGNNHTNIYNNQDFLYAKVDGEYTKVTVTRESNYTYTYELPDGTTIASGGRFNDSPSITGTDDGYLYLLTNQITYIYTYTDSANNVQTIGTSTGANNNRYDDNSDITLYQRSVNTSGGGSRLAAIKSAATVFVNAVAAKAGGKDQNIATTEDNINHRIAVVGFASQSGYGNNTELLSISGWNSGSVGVAYNDITPQNLKDVVQDMNTTAGQDMVKAAINALAANGATQINLGMDMAKRILENNPVNGENRKRVVVVFTDGAPTSFNGFEYAVATAADRYATDIKEMGVTVYSVGVFPGADASSAGTDPEGNLNQNSNKMTAACNWFMQKISTNNGKPQNPSYYLSASDAETLNSIFSQISQQIPTGGSSTELTGTAVVKDIVSQFFKLPDGANKSSITLETYQYNGPDAAQEWTKNPDAMGAEAAVKDKDVSVTGFDFAKNWCGITTNLDGSKTYRGNKLVIRFDVTPEPGFIGGNEVPTNASAGIYEEGATEPAQTFDVPTVNVPVGSVTVGAEDKNVYLKGSVTADDLKAGGTVTVTGIELDLSRANDTDKPYGLDKWQTEYVDIIVTVKDENGKEIPAEGWKDLTDDRTYTFEVTVHPKNEATDTTVKGPAAEDKTDRIEKKVNVFKPELTYKDSEAYYGDNAPDFNDNYVSTVWKHGETVADESVMGAAPTLDKTYATDEGKIVNGKINTKKDIPVKVDVSIKVGEVAVPVTKYTTFVHDNCNVSGCTWKDNADTAKGNPAFLIHVKTCTLTITKAGGTTGDPYVFEVKKDDQPYTEVTVKGGESVKIVELPVGTYSIKEKTDWSWRYTPSYDKEQVTLSSGNANDSITCTNTSKNDKWLNDYAVKSNTYQTGTPATDGNN